MKHKMRIALSSLALGFLIAACGGPSTPVAVPEPTSRPPAAAARPIESSPVPRRERTLEATVAAPTNTPEIKIDLIPPISFDLTAKLRHLYQQPSNASEEYAHKIFVEGNNDYVGYMKAVRSMNNILWYNSAFGVVKNPLNGFAWASLLNKTIKQMEIDPYPAIETMLEFLMKDPINQTYVEIGIEHVQETPIGDVEIDGSPDMGKDEFKKFMRGLFAQEEQPKEEAIAYEIPKIPDGSKVVFVKIEDVAPAYRTGYPLAMYLANFSTKEVFKLTSGKFNDMHPDLSPDGKLIAFSSNMGDEYDIWLMDIETRRIAKLTDENLGDETSSWSNDGRSIVFRRFGDIYSIDLDKECKLKLAETNVYVMDQSFSPDNSQVLYDKGDLGFRIPVSFDDYGVWIVNSDGSNPHKFKVPELFKEPDWYRTFKFIDWSNNGKIASIMIEFSYNDNEIYNGVVIMDSDGSNVKKITWNYAGSPRVTPKEPEILNYYEPTWSQDGNFLFYKQGTSGFIFGVYKGDDLGLYATDPKTGETLDIRNFNWNTIDVPLIEVSLEELLGIEGKQPYTKECLSSVSEKEETKLTPIPEVEVETFGKNIKYLWNINAEYMQYSFDGDRDIKVEITYGNKAKIKNYSIEGTLAQSIINETVKISSKKLKSNPTAVITELESTVLDSLKDLGVLSLDVIYFQEGNQRYTN